MNTMHASQHTAVVVAQLLDQLDHSSVPADAHQYRTVAARLAQLLADTDIDWQPLLERSPAAATVYENMYYASAGLCRAPLAQAAAAEVLARRAIDSARQRPAAGSTCADAAPG